MPDTVPFGETRVLSATDQVFEALYSAIVTLDLPPGMKVSEAEIAKQMGMSRQPVRDAFFRLSELGFLRIRPQRATTISLISEQAILDAHFIRTALEVECLRAAVARATAPDFDGLDALLFAQRQAIESDDPRMFHTQDDAFHRAICIIAGHPLAWNLIKDQKVHLERIRFLSLSYGASLAHHDHSKIVDAMRTGDVETAEAAMRSHLGNILGHVDNIRASHADYFAVPAE